MSSSDVSLSCFASAVTLCVLAGCGRVEYDPPSVDAAAEDARVSLSCHERYAQVIFCDDFEEAGFPDWNPFRSVPTAAISPTMRVGGGTAVRFHVPVGREAAILGRPLDPPLTTGPVFMRAYVRAPATFVQSSFIVIAEIRDGSSKISFDLEVDDRAQLSTPGAYVGAPGTFPRDVWVCVEVEGEIAPAGGAGYARLHVDGEPVVDVPVGTDTSRPAGYIEAVVGANSGAANGAVTIEVDAFVLARSRVGCD